MLAVSGLRDELPKTRELAERPVEAGWPGMIADQDEARAELHAALEYQAGRAYAQEEIG